MDFVSLPSSISRGNMESITEGDPAYISWAAGDGFLYRLLIQSLPSAIINSMGGLAGTHLFVSWYYKGAWRSYPFFAGGIQTPAYVKDAFGLSLDFDDPMLGYVSSLLNMVLHQDSVEYGCELFDLVAAGK